MRDGRSLTSDLVAAVRAYYSACPADLDTVHDPLAAELLPRAMAWPAQLVRRMPPLARAGHLVAGMFSMGLSYLIPLRTRAIDAALAHDVERGTRQLVILGAGLDTRAFRLPLLADCRVFEVDHPNTQDPKRAKVAGHLPACRELRFCAIDFERQGLSQVLEAAGFDRQAPAFWIWEGVTMYLSREALEATANALAELSAPGSAVACTYMPPAVMRRSLTAAGGSLLGVIGEPIIGAIDSAAIADVFAGHGFEPESDRGAEDWAAHYWGPREVPFVRGYERLLVARKTRPGQAGSSSGPG
ncbi:MAG: class I SAM-dependent methyltransferase [Myxococcales bacterium]|nr:class I SAM-dependent methyltransferase [Myxococcales bacterium]